MNRLLPLLLLSALLLAVVPVVIAAAQGEERAAPSPSALSLITETPDEGFALAIRLARKGVTETQPDREVLHALRPEYARDAESLIAASHVIAVHFQTIAAANDYWR